MIGPERTRGFGVQWKNPLDSVKSGADAERRWPFETARLSWREEEAEATDIGTIKVTRKLRTSSSEKNRSSMPQNLSNICERRMLQMRI